MRDIQRFSYHNHTTFSDGQNTPEEMIAKAIDIGFTEIGISDHLIVHKNIKQSPSWDMMTQNNGTHIYQKDFADCLEKYKKHCDHLRKLSLKNNIKIYIGFEVDFFTYDGWLEEFKYFLSQIDYDYVLSGNHFLYEDECKTILNIHKSLGDIYDRDYIGRLIGGHFCNIRKAVESGLFKFIAHLDYVRKMGEDFCRPSDYWAQKMSVLDALATCNVGLEISTKGLRKVGDYYPCKEIISETSKRNIKVVISDDAHRTDELGYKFNEAEETLLKNNMFRRLHF